MTHARRGSLSARSTLTLVLRVTLETGIVGALGYLGYHAGSSTVSRAALAISFPAIGFGFWGLVDFRGLRHAELRRLTQELVISAIAAGGMYATGRHYLGWSLGGLSLGYHALVYLQGGRLLEAHRASNVRI